MALLVFDSTPNPPTAIADLLSPAQRMKTAGEVNAAILESLSQGKEVKLMGLLKLLCWGETMLEEKAEFPKVRILQWRGEWSTHRGAAECIRRVVFMCKVDREMEGDCVRYCTHDLSQHGCISHSPSTTPLLSLSALSPVCLPP